MARRRLTQAEKLQNKADRINRKAAEAMPLFASILPQVTAKDVYWKSRFDRAKGCEEKTSFALATLTCARWRRVAAEVLGAELAQTLDAYQRSTYPQHLGDYEQDFWRQLLCGRKRVVYR